MISRIQTTQPINTLNIGEIQGLKAAKTEKKPNPDENGSLSSADQKSNWRVLRVIWFVPSLILSVFSWVLEKTCSCCGLSSTSSLNKKEELEDMLEKANGMQELFKKAQDTDVFRNEWKNAFFSLPLKLQNMIIRRDIEESLVSQKEDLATLRKAYKAFLANDPNSEETATARTKYDTALNTLITAEFETQKDYALAYVSELYMEKGGTPFYAIGNNDDIPMYLNDIIEHIEEELDQNYSL